MANRHTHKKLRAEVRARMAATGESHQTALQRIRERSKPASEAPDLLAARYFGLPITIAAYTVLSRLSLILVSGADVPLGIPLGRPSPLRVQTGTWQ